MDYTVKTGNPFVFLDNKSAAAPKSKAKKKKNKSKGSETKSNGVEIEPVETQSHTEAEATGSTDEDASTAQALAEQLVVDSDELRHPVVVEEFRVRTKKKKQDQKEKDKGVRFESKAAKPKAATPQEADPVVEVLALGKYRENQVRECKSRLESELQPVTAASLLKALQDAELKQALSTAASAATPVNVSADQKQPKSILKGKKPPVAKKDKAQGSAAPQASQTPVSTQPAPRKGSDAVAKSSSAPAAETKQAAVSNVGPEAASPVSDVAASYPPDSIEGLQARAATLDLATDEGADVLDQWAQELPNPNFAQTFLASRALELIVGRLMTTVFSPQYNTKNVVPKKLQRAVVTIFSHGLAGSDATHRWMYETLRKISRFVDGSQSRDEHVQRVLEAIGHQKKCRVSLQAATALLSEKPAGDAKVPTTLDFGINEGNATAFFGDTDPTSPMRAAWMNSTTLASNLQASEGRLSRYAVVLGRNPATELQAGFHALENTVSQVMRETKRVQERLLDEQSNVTKGMEAAQQSKAAAHHKPDAGREITRTNLLNRKRQLELELAKINVELGHIATEDDARKKQADANVTKYDQEFIRLQDSLIKAKTDLKEQGADHMAAEQVHAMVVEIWNRINGDATSSFKAVGEGSYKETRNYMRLVQDYSSRAADFVERLNKRIEVCKTKQETERKYRKDAIALGLPPHNPETEKILEQTAAQDTKVRDVVLKQVAGLLVHCARVVVDPKRVPQSDPFLNEMYTMYSTLFKSLDAKKIFDLTPISGALATLTSKGAGPGQFHQQQQQHQQQQAETKRSSPATTRPGSASASTASNSVLPSPPTANGPSPHAGNRKGPLVSGKAPIQERDSAIASVGPVISSASPKLKTREGLGHGAHSPSNPPKKLNPVDPSALSIPQAAGVKRLPTPHPDTGTIVLDSPLSNAGLNGDVSSASAPSSPPQPKAARRGPRGATRTPQLSSHPPGFAPIPEISSSPNSIPSSADSAIPSSTSAVSSPPRHPPSNRAQQQPGSAQRRPLPQGVGVPASPAQAPDPLSLRKGWNKLPSDSAAAPSNSAAGNASSGFTPAANDASKSDASFPSLPTSQKPLSVTAVSEQSTVYKAKQAQQQKEEVDTLASNAAQQGKKERPKKAARKDRGGSDKSGSEQQTADKPKKEGKRQQRQQQQNQDTESEKDKQQPREKKESKRNTGNKQQQGQGGSKKKDRQDQSKDSDAASTEQASASAGADSSAQQETSASADSS